MSKFIHLASTEAAWTVTHWKATSCVKTIYWINQPSPVILLTGTQIYYIACEPYYTIGHILSHDNMCRIIRINSQYVCMCICCIVTTPLCEVAMNT